ncbi:type VI secretion system ATPase TssH, partial [bacterium]
DVFNILLQVLDDGRLTDSKGRTVDFKNTIIIMTSNLGSHLISEKISSGFKDDEEWEETFANLKQDLFQLLKQTIRPEFLNRVDEVIVFKPLSQSDIREVVSLQLKRVQELLQGKDITLEITDDAKDWIAKLGFDPVYGARPLKRVIQKHIINPLSEYILKGDFSEGDTVEIGLDRLGLLEFSKRGVSEPEPAKR